MSHEQNCFICAQPAKINERESFGLINECSQCGKILFDFDARSLLEDTNVIKFKSCLYYYFTQYKRDIRTIYCISNNGKCTDDGCTYVDTNEILSMFPRNLSERIDMILQNLSKLSNYMGAEIAIGTKQGTYEHLLFIAESENADSERKYIIEMLCDRQLLKRTNRETGFFDFITIDYLGWQRIDELNKINTQHGQGFIAMMFGASTKDIRQAIKEGIIGAGYEESIIDEVSFNGQVVPEMLYQIRMSDFIVADLTGNRGGVYFEAGYALGMRKEVIFTVDNRILDEQDQLPKDERTQIPHFDVAQYNQIRYNSPDDLSKKLTERIVATVGDRRNKL